MKSARHEALDAMVERLRSITVANGYDTDAGLAAFVGEVPVTGPDDAPASLAVMVKADEPRYQGENVAVTLPVDVQVVVRADLSDVLGTIERTLADVKRAVEQDHDLGGTLVPRGLERGSVAPLDREPGSETVGVSVRYSLMYREGWGSP